MRPSDPRLRRLLAPARPQLLGVVGAGVVSSVLVLVQAWAVTALVVAVVRSGDLTGPALATVAALALRGLVGWAGDVLAARAAAVVGTSLRRRLIRAVVDRSGAASSGSVSSGSVSVLATRGVAAAEPYLTRYLPAVVLAAVLPAITVVAILSQDLLSALIVVGTLPLLPLFGALVGLATRDRAREQWREMAALSGHFLDVVRGLPTLVAHRRATAQSARIGQITERYRLASLRTLRIAFASSAVLELVATLSVALVAVTVGVRLASGSLGLHTALLVLLLAPEAYWPLRRVGAEFHAAAEGVATFEAIDALVPPDDAVTATAAPRPGAPLVVAGLQVVHPGRSLPALDGLDAVLPGSGVTVVTGPSGCGKSTLLAALAGLLTPTAGSVTVDGAAGSAVAVAGDAWRSQVAWSPQRPFFTAGSIRDNLTVARPGAVDAQLWDALRRVALEERVLALPAGLDCPLGEDGATLSAGERARLALARVVLSDRRWALLDEPTAHLDELTEQVVADTLVDLGRRGAVVVVSHRPALLALADRTIALRAPQPAHRAPRPTTPRPTRRAPEPRPLPPAGAVGFGLATMLGALSSASGVALTATAGWLIVQASTTPAVLTLLVAIVGVRTFGLARPLLRWAERLRSHDAALRLLARRRVEVYDSVVPLVPARLGRRRGDVLTAVVDDVDAVVDRPLRVVLPVRTAVAVSLLATLVAAVVLPPAGAVLAGGAGLSAGGAYWLARLGAGRAERDGVRLRAGLSEAVTQTVQTADELAMWQAGGRAGEQVAALSDEVATAARTASAWLGAARAVVLAATGATIAVTALVTGAAVTRGDVSGPMAALLVLLPLALADVVLPVADAGALTVRTRAAADRLARLEHTAPAVRETVSVPAPVGTDLSADQVAARWCAAAPLTVPVSFALAPGGRLAVVGPSGSGKSTLAALLLRFLDPVSGSIRLGGVGARSLSLDDVRRLTGLVDDDPHVFASTLVENVRLARPGATDDEVDAALRRAHLGDWLDGLPDGLDTWLGDGHAQVSGGERARLAVARSLLADQPVLVLDEPAAHLDHATGTALAEEVLGADRGRTVVWITHDRVGLDLVDQVVDLGPATTWTVPAAP